MFNFDWFDLLSGVSRAVNDETQQDDQSLWDDPNIVTQGNYEAMRRRLAAEDAVRVPYIRRPNGDNR